MSFSNKQHFAHKNWKLENDNNIKYHCNKFPLITQIFYVIHTVSEWDIGEDRKGGGGGGGGVFGDGGGTCPSQLLTCARHLWMD